MSEIHKLELKVKNSKKFNSTEIRMSIHDAINLLKEIESLKTPPTIVIKEIEVPVKTIEIWDAGSL